MMLLAKFLNSGGAQMNLTSVHETRSSRVKASCNYNRPINGLRPSLVRLQLCGASIDAHIRYHWGN